MGKSASSSSVGELLDRIGERVPWGKAAGWDPVGLQIGDPRAPVARIALCHEVGEAVVAAVTEERPDLLISYHPLLFRPTRTLVAGASSEGRALRLARAGIALAVVHTSYDVVRGGAADALAEALDLVGTQGFGPLRGGESSKLVTFVPEAAADRVLDALTNAGAGRIGAYTHCSFRSEGIGTFFAGAGTDPALGRKGELNREPELRLELTVPGEVRDRVVAALLEAHPYEEPAYDVYERWGDAGLVGRVGVLEAPLSLAELAQCVRKTLGDSPLRVAGDPGRPVSRVAVAPGSGQELLPEAHGSGADVFVSGDLAHHAVREALDRGLAVIDAGHVPTERPGLERLFGLLASLDLECRSYLELDPHPFWAPLG
ncbi:MAG: Nif3-like dinuclear metal center hexameric protein [Myxococcota bacterium]